MKTSTKTARYSQLAGRFANVSSRTRSNYGLNCTIIELTGDSDSMTRLVLCSEDSKLLPLLSSALKPLVCLQLESNKEQVKQIAAQDNAEVIVLDFDCNYS